MNENLLLRIRSETLQAHIDKTVLHVKGLPALRTSLASLETQLEAIRKLVLGLRHEETTLIELYPDLADSHVFDETEKLIEGLKQSVAIAKQRVADLKQLSFYIPDDPMVAEVSQRFLQYASPVKTELSNVQQAIQNKTPIDRATWDRFRRQAVEPSQAIFAEFVDLIGGIAIRDSRFDGGICSLADELIRSYAPVASARVPVRTIPTRYHDVYMKLARFVRLGFPEWTVWALPLTAHEFWFIDAKETLDVELRDRASALLASPEPIKSLDLRDQRCLADAFAAYTMGPAYGYAAITLLLDPRAMLPNGSGEICHDVRAYTIIETIKLLNDRFSAADRPYTRMIKQLDEMWRAASLQAAEPRPAEQEAELNTQKARASVLLRALVAVLDGHGCPVLTIEAWTQVAELKDRLLKQEAGEIGLPPGAELRQVLNAAWLARIDPAEVPEAGLAERVLKLLESIGQPKATPNAAGFRARRAS